MSLRLVNHFNSLFAVVLCLLTWCASSHAQTRTPRSAASLIVKLKPGAASSQALSNAIAKYTSAALSPERQLVRSRSGKGSNAQAVSVSGLDRIYVIPVSESESSAAISELKALAQIEYVQPNYIYSIDQASAADPGIDRQWYLRNVRADKAWEIERGDSAISVGVLDTGVDWLHPDLRTQTRINAAEDVNRNGFFEAWSASEKREDIHGNLVNGDLDGIDQDNNGYADDVIGYDFVDQETLNFGDASGRDPVPGDEHSHGTLVSGVIAAAQNNSEGISGIAPGCRIVALRAFDATGNAEDDDVASAIIYAADNGVRVLNLSFGDFVPSMLQRDAIRYAVARGVTIFASSGNEGGFDRHYPSDFDEVISVGATANIPFEDILASLTTYGEGMDLVAPGADIYTTDVDGKYKSVSGTSFSTPIAAAIGALLLSKNTSLTPEEVRGVLTSTARDLGEKSYDPEYANGRVDAYSALQYRGGATIRFASPRTNDGFKVGATLAIKGTAVSTLFTGYTLSYAKALDPKVIIKRDNARDWKVIRQGQDQIINGDLGIWNTTGLEPGLYTLRLAVTSSDQRSTEERMNVQVIGEPLRLIAASVDTIFVNEKRGLLIRATADRIARFQVEYRVSGSTAWSTKTDDRMTLGHGLLLTTKEVPIGSTLDVRVTLTDATGQTIDTTFVAGIMTDAIAQSGFERKSYALPPGYALDTVLANPAGDQVIMSVYPDGVNFGPLTVFQFNDNKFAKVDSLKETWIPRAIGNTQGGARELLLQADRNSALYAGEGLRSILGTQIFRSTSADDLWGSELIDVDGDGREEIIAKSTRHDGSRFEDVYVALTYRNGAYVQLGQTKNVTTPARGQAVNRYTEPNTAAADLNGNGKLEIVTIDNDADVVAYEFNNATLSFDVTFTLENEGFADGSLLTSGDLNGDGRPDIAFGYHTDFDLNPNREYDPAFWTVKVLLNQGGGKFEEAFDDNFYFARPLTPYRSSVRTIRDVTGDGKDDLVVSLFPNFYLLAVHGQEDVSPVWHHPVSVSARGAVAFDFDRNNILEFGFVAGDSIRFFERDADYVGRTATPGGLTVIPIDESRVDLEWGSVAGAEEYLVLRVEQGVQQFDVIAEVTDTRYSDTDVEEGVTYFYSVIAIDSSKATPQSLLALSVRAFVHPKPVITRVIPVGGQHLRVQTTASISSSFTSGGAFVIDDSIASTTKIGGDSVLIVTPFKKLSAGAHTLRVASRELRDRFNSPFDTSVTLTWIQPDADIDTQRFYIVRWKFEESRRIRIVFNSSPSDDALSVDKYTLDPYGKLVRVYRDTSDRNALFIDLAEGTKIVALGKPFVLCVSDIHDEFGIAIEETKGSCVGVTLTEPDLENVMVYPNPARRSNRELMFARLTAEAEISIFTMDMRFIRQIKTTERSGGVLWDMRDEHGEQLPSGIYLYQARGKDDNGNAVDDKAAKFVIIADQ